MTRQEHLKFCKICKNQKFDKFQGIICGLTDMIADFDDSCKFFEEDSELKEILTIKEAEKDFLNRKASLGKRFANLLIDYIFQLVLVFIFSLIIWGLLALISMETFYSVADSKIIDYLLAFIFGTAYYSIFEYFSGKTIGKYITNTRVVDQDGNKPNFNTILMRTLCRYIPFEPISFFGPDELGWHDRISKTIVIED